ncbi:transmembrane protein CCDC163 [Pongo abelii]|uniref:transmembrane protein CCDC163 n=1 Tax=Pongo abelii TaxID=9601 RepID=UPI003006E7AB
MYRSLSWFEQLDVLLNATNGNVVRIKQWLYPLGVSTAARDLAGTWISSHHLPLQSGVQAQQPWALETPTVPQRLSCPEQAVQGLLEEREQQKYQISVLEGNCRAFGARCGSKPKPKPRCKQDKENAVLPMAFLRSCRLTLNSVFWTVTVAGIFYGSQIPRGAPFLTWSPASFSSMPRVLSKRTYSFGAPKCS